MSRISEYQDMLSARRTAWDPTEGVVTLNRAADDIAAFEMHHTGAPGPASLSFYDKQRWLLSIERYHEDTKGWSDIFYNTFVFADGTIWEGRNALRSSTSKAHDALTVHIPGNSPEITPEQHESLVRVARWATLGNPANVRGHSDRATTACPGDSGRAELTAIKEALTMSTDHTHEYQNLGDHRDAVAAAKAGIWNGDNPTGAASRSTVAVMVQRAIDDLMEEVQALRDLNDVLKTRIRRLETAQRNGTVSADSIIEEIRARLVD